MWSAIGEVRTMTADELRAAMYGANLRSGSLGELIGCGAPQIRDWTSGRRPVPARYVSLIIAAVRERSMRQPEAPKAPPPAAKSVPPKAGKQDAKTVAAKRRSAPSKPWQPPADLPPSSGNRKSAKASKSPKRSRRKAIKVIDPVALDAARPVRDPDNLTLADTIADLAAGMAAMLAPIVGTASDNTNRALPSPTPAGVSIGYRAPEPAAPARPNARASAWIKGDVLPGAMRGVRCAFPVSARDMFGVVHSGFCGHRCEPNSDTCSAHSAAQIQPRLAVIAR